MSEFRVFSFRRLCVYFPFRPALIQSTGAMKCLLDAMLVLTKQDRLCHVIHATSEPFYQTWLRKANVMQHCKVCTLPKTCCPCGLVLIQAAVRFSPSATVPSRKRGCSSEIGLYLTYLRNFEWASHFNTYGTRLAESLPIGRITSLTTVRFLYTFT